MSGRRFCLCGRPAHRGRRKQRNKGLDSFKFVYVIGPVDLRRFLIEIGRYINVNRQWDLLVW